MDATELSIEEVDQRVKSDIQSYGWSILASEFQGMIYAHTVGLESSFEHPEIETLGLSEELATLFLNELAKWVKGGRRLEAGTKINELVEDYQFILVTNPEQPEGVPTTDGRLRLIWPDCNQRYPWESECEADCRMQTLLPGSFASDEMALTA
ncbi:MAG: DUF4262 domain-containing protein [SAR324 cluster bacterium]|nr:DUF4262 domain-containing protein [SAR324 cluster bacterium]